MSEGPVDLFAVLMRACINDDRGAQQSIRSLFTFTALSFALGIAASAFTAYLLSLLGL